MEPNPPPLNQLIRKTTSEELIDVTQLKENVLSAVVAMDSKKRRSITQRNFSQIATAKMEQSRAEIERKLKSDPSNILLRKMYANLLSNLEHLEEAIEQLRICIDMTNKQKSDPILSSQCRNDLGLVLKRLGDFEQAQLFLEDAVKLNPNNAAARLNLGNVYVKLNLLDNAEECYKAVLQLDKNLTKNYINLALLYEQKQQWLDAVNVYEQALNLEPNSMKAYHNIGRCYAQIPGKSKESAAAFRKGKSQAHIQQNKHKQTYTAIELSLDINSLVVSHYGLAQLHKSTGNLFEADKEYETIQSLLDKKEAILPNKMNSNNNSTNNNDNNNNNVSNNLKSVEKIEITTKSQETQTQTQTKSKSKEKIPEKEISTTTTSITAATTTTTTITMDNNSQTSKHTNEHRRSYSSGSGSATNLKSKSKERLPNHSNSNSKEHFVFETHRRTQSETTSQQHQQQTNIKSKSKERIPNYHSNSNSKEKIPSPEKHESNLQTHSAGSSGYSTPTDGTRTTTTGGPRRHKRNTSRSMSRGKLVDVSDVLVQVYEQLNQEQEVLEKRKSMKAAAALSDPNQTPTTTQPQPQQQPQQIEQENIDKIREMLQTQKKQMQRRSRSLIEIIPSKQQHNNNDSETQQTDNNDNTNTETRAQPTPRQRHNTKRESMQLMSFEEALRNMEPAPLSKSKTQPNLPIPSTSKLTNSDPERSTPPDSPTLSGKPKTLAESGKKNTFSRFTSMIKEVKEGVKTHRTNLYNSMSLRELIHHHKQDNLNNALIFDCIIFVEERGLTREGIFRVNASITQVKTLLKAYHRGKHLELERFVGNDVHSVAGLLKNYLNGLTDPLLGNEHYAVMIGLMSDFASHEQNENESQDSDKSETTSKNEGKSEKNTQGELERTTKLISELRNYLCSKLTPDVLTVLTRIFEMLEKVNNTSSTNQMNAMNLSRIFGPILVRNLTLPLQQQLDDTPFCSAMVEFMILHRSLIFANLSSTLEVKYDSETHNTNSLGRHHSKKKVRHLHPEKEGNSNNNNNNNNVDSDGETEPTGQRKRGLTIGFLQSSKK